ncbi:MAG TPA: DUF3261 domain-containing protein [Ideonella sp.]|uniref:DUF3261 domain-containing protein n=1 Tax=Ideonella sp. TaxID=1929293 RepID=UPI002E34B2D6|nr:DUF3261 domain-containing protein [Ideonella sp.]HEX5686917.1 DUF3261 domain-containing protein [Ideonella sp.]
MFRCSVRLVASALLSAMLTACASAPPAPVPSAAVSFRLPPASLGRTLAWQQRLQVTSQGRTQPPLDALLEADAQALRLALLGTGQTLARLEWDGRSLKAEQAAGWPKEIPAERVLSDMQLALWPLAALQAALPADATLADEGPLRVLRQHGTVVTTVRDAGSLHIELVNQALGYTLRIDSMPIEGATP